MRTNMSGGGNKNGTIYRLHGGDQAFSGCPWWSAARLITSVAVATAICGVPAVVYATEPGQEAQEASAVASGFVPAPDGADSTLGEPATSEPATSDGTPGEDSSTAQTSASEQDETPTETSDETLTKDPTETSDGSSEKAPEKDPAEIPEVNPAPAKVPASGQDEAPVPTPAKAPAQSPAAASTPNATASTQDAAASAPDGTQSALDIVKQNGDAGKQGVVDGQDVMNAEPINQEDYEALGLSVDDVPSTAEAQDAVNQAQAALDAAQTDDEKRAAQAALDKAKVTLQKAQAAEENAKSKAPYSTDRVSYVETPSEIYVAANGAAGNTYTVRDGFDKLNEDVDFNSHDNYTYDVCKDDYGFIDGAYPLLRHQPRRHGQLHRRPLLPQQRLARQLQPGQPHGQGRRGL